MLRALFGEPPREWGGPELETVRVMEQFIRKMEQDALTRPDRSAKCRTYAMWTEGLLRSLDELEQSRYAAARYAGQVHARETDRLSPQERLSYDRHVYFDKNAYIRVFALLDKLGTLMNDYFKLETERIKVRFSYFTVLRKLRQERRHPELADRLGELKDRHRDALDRLRRRRNAEIHYMNAELLDDLRQTLEHAGGEAKLENLAANLSDLDEAWELIQGTLLHTFRYVLRGERGHR